MSLVGDLKTFVSFRDQSVTVGVSEFLEGVMGVAAVAHYLLPDTAYEMWVRNELADYLHLPQDGTQVEIVGGEIVVSPGPPVDHNEIVRDVEKVFFAADFRRTGFEWEAVHTTDLNLIDIGDGCIPDLVVVDRETLVEARKQRVQHLFPAQVAMVMEVTSPGNAAADRPPMTLRSLRTKWSGYAHSGIGHYLLVDRDPQVAQVLLYAHPDREEGTYTRVAGVWNFGETVELPEPFGVEVPTKLWEPWES